MRRFPIPFLYTISALLLLFVAGRALDARAQVRFVSPLPDGILQVDRTRDSAYLHVQADVDSEYSDFVIRLSDKISDWDVRILLDWTGVRIQNGRVDTVIAVAASRHEYTLEWHVRAAIGVGGTVLGLRAGHIFAIAGQSNAQGFNWNMLDTAVADVRMLRDTLGWRRAAEPTGGEGGGPWIVMANLLSQKLNDSLPIGIVNTAYVGSSLLPAKNAERWYRNAAHPFDSGIYGAAVRKFRAAGSVFEALLWIQGESDGTDLLDPLSYCDAFDTLLAGFRTDLHQPDLRSFHLQISGIGNPAPHEEHLPEVREAHRILRPSTLVGTAVGRSLVDGLHYSVATYRSVGKMFADAIASEFYGRASEMYPPLVPDTAATVDSDATGAYYIRLKWHRGTMRSVPLALVTNRQAFALERDLTETFDTSRVWSRIDPNDAGSVLIGVRDGTIDPDHDWTLTYIPTQGADRAPLAEVPEAGGDTLYAVGFLHLPVLSPDSLPTSSVRDITQLEAFPTPTKSSLTILLRSVVGQTAAFDLSDIDGRLVRSTSVQLLPGWNRVSMFVGDLPTQACVLTVRTPSTVLTRKLLLLR